MLRNSIYRVLLALFSICLVYSCSPAKKAARKEQKQREAYKLFFATHRGEFATDCSENFPPNLSYKKGDTIVKRDTIFQPGKIIRVPVPGDCPDSLSVKCPDCENTHTETYRVDTVTHEDVQRLTAEQFKTKYLSALADSLTRENTALQADLTKTKKTSKERGIIILSAIGVAILLIILKIKKVL